MAQFGNAGATFNGDASKKFGSANSGAGASGERWFSGFLKTQGITDKYSVFASLRGPDKRYRTDIDFVVANGNKVILIDVKRWSAKKPYWSLFGMPMFGAGPLLSKGKWEPLSKNMEMVRDQLQKKMPSATIYAAVVFVGTGKNLQTPPFVAPLIWPGGIRSYKWGSAPGLITRKLGKPEPVSRQVESTLAGLVQRG